MVITRSQSLKNPTFKHVDLDDLQALRRKLKRGKFVLERETDPAILELYCPAADEEQAEPSQEEVTSAPKTQPPSYALDYERPDDMAGPGPATMEVRASLMEQDPVRYNALFYEAFMQDWQRHNDWLDLVRSREVDQDVCPVEVEVVGCEEQEESILVQSLLSDSFDFWVGVESITGGEQQDALDAYKQHQELSQVFNEENPFAGMTPEEIEQQLALLGNWM